MKWHGGAVEEHRYIVVNYVNLFHKGMLYYVHTAYVCKVIDCLGNYSLSLSQKKLTFSTTTFLEFCNTFTIKIGLIGEL